MTKMKVLNKKDFFWVEWKEGNLEREKDKFLKERKLVIDKIKKIKKEERNFNNTIFSLEKSGREISAFMTRVDILKNMSPLKKIRKKAGEIEVEFSQKMIEIEFDEGIFRALKEYKNNFYKKEKIDKYDKKLFLDYFRDYRDMGFALKKEDQKKLQRINQEILDLSSQFSVNINNWEDYILLSQKEIDGLNDLFLNSLKKKNGKYLVSLDYPEINPFLEMSENDKKRKEILIKSSQKGGKENLRLLEKILALKKKKADLLGYKTYSDYIVKNRMAKKAKNVQDFTENLLEKVKKKGREDIKELEKFKKKLKNDKEVRVEAHDISFLISKMEKEKFNIDQQELKEYFQLENVKKEMFGIFSNLFGFQIKKNNSVKLWHGDVEFYDIYFKEKKISHLAMDLHPRKGKYGHAAMWDVESGYQIDLEKKDRQAPMALVVCNFAKKNSSTPSLLDHNEIKTLFHEFGHALHHILSKAKHASDFGVAVSWDFVETPSQLLENWAWDKEFLKKVSNHWKSGEKLSDEKIDKLIQSRKFMKGYFNLRQLLMTKFDFDIHFKNIKKLNEYWKKLMKKGTGIDVYKESLMPAGFGHIVGGYDSGYYSYMWALVYADDIFSAFKKEGIYNKKTGRRYWKEILSEGGQRDEKKSVGEFLKRPSNNRAFLKNIK